MNDGPLLVYSSCQKKTNYLLIIIYRFLPSRFTSYKKDEMALNTVWGKFKICIKSLRFVNSEMVLQ